MKKYPIEIDTLYDDGSLCGVFSKGHHPPEEFLALMKSLGWTEYDPKEVKHDWRRWEICSDYDGGWVRCLNHATQGKRGVFPVTIIEWI